MQNLPEFDWNDLRYFVAVAREGSTLAAAKALGVSQTTVQRRLAALEKQIGCELIEPRPTGYCLTELGRVLLPFAQRVEPPPPPLRRISLAYAAFRTDARWLLNLRYARFVPTVRARSTATTPVAASV